MFSTKWSHRQYMCMSRWPYRCAVHSMCISNRWNGRGGDSDQPLVRTTGLERSILQDSHVTRERHDLVRCRSAAGQEPSHVSNLRQNVSPGGAERRMQLLCFNNELAGALRPSMLMLQIELSALLKLLQVYPGLLKSTITNSSPDGSIFPLIFRNPHSHMPNEHAIVLIARAAE